MDYIEVESETIQLIGYDIYKKILEIQFKEGPTHQYSPVEKAIFDNFKTADSYNDYFINFIRDNFELHVVDEGKIIYPVEFWERKQRDLVTQFVDFNLMTLSDLIKDNTIDLKPEYQRRYRWNDIRQSKLIESFLMNVPVPPIFLNEDDIGMYSVIDGKQRLISIHNFLIDKLKLKGLEVFAKLNGKYYSTLQQKFQRIIKTRAILRAIIILRQSDDDIKYKVFQRLNTGGVSLNAQEIRNSAYPGPLNDLILKLSENSIFQKLLGVLNKEESTIYQEMKDVEFVLRFFTFFENPNYFSGDISQKMSEYMHKNQRMDSSKLENLKSKFNSTIRIVDKLFGDDAFKRWRSGTQSWKKKITAPLFDAVMFSCVKCIGIPIPTSFDKEDFISKYKELFLDNEFQDAISFHVNTSVTFNIRVEKVYNLIIENL